HLHGGGDTGERHPGVDTVHTVEGRKRFVDGGYAISADHSISQPASAASLRRRDRAEPEDHIEWRDAAAGSSLAVLRPDGVAVVNTSFGAAGITTDIPTLTSTG